MNGRSMKNGCVLIKLPDHHRADSKGYVRETTLIAEKALGKPLPPGAVVHHVNGIRSDNRPENLVICQDENYHRLLHRRMRALAACGHKDWRKCPFCKKYYPMDKLHKGGRKDGSNVFYYHKTCAAEYHRTHR